MQNVTPNVTRISSNFIEDRWEEIETNDAVRRSKYWLGIIIPNYSIPDISKYLTKVSYFSVVSHCPLTHYLITHLRTLTTAKERFIKQFYWLHSIQFTSSNSLCCSLYPPRIIYIYIYVYNLFRSNRFDLFDLYWKRPRVTTSRRPSLKKKTSDKSVILLLPPRKISNYLVN